MGKDWMGYEQMAQAALRSVVRMALERAATQGLPGDHHFYIQFDTRHPGVRIAPYLQERYPDDMTIVLQHQFSGLKVGEETFEVTLSFNKVGETLVIPYAALKSFYDPSVKFALQFRPGPHPPQLTAPKRPEALAGPSAPAPALPRSEAKVAADEPAPMGEVVSLDAFRKKS